MSTAVEPWHRDVDESAGPRMHAFVVGVSYYDYLKDGKRYSPKGPTTFDLRQVETPATSALLIARWLRDEWFHPTLKIGSIRLLLSPSETELEAVSGMRGEAAKVQRAVSENVRAQLRAWRDTFQGPQDLAVFYAGGHGVQTGSDKLTMVLLEDFAKDDEIFNYALNVGRVFRGMSASNRPQNQIYFVDACRNTPEAAKKIRDGGQGVGLPDEEDKGPEERSAPMFFSAPPGAKAPAGTLGQGTYFVQALLDCVRLWAASPPKSVYETVEEKSRWHISTDTLTFWLNKRLGQLSKGHRIGPPGGLPNRVVFHFFKQPPKVKVTIDVNPDPVAQFATASLLDETESARHSKVCIPKPCLFEDVSAGLYTLHIAVQPPHKERRIPLTAEPPETLHPVNFP